MKQLLFSLTFCCAAAVFAQKDSSSRFLPSPYVNFDDYMALAQEVQVYRQDRLVSLADFNRLSAGPNTVILDTRSQAMYDAKHVKGAIHLDFSDFTQANLAFLIPDPNTTVLIYCNNNFILDRKLEVFDRYFATKSGRPIRGPQSEEQDALSANPLQRNVTLALNIPTFINLYGYGYRNVYELGELVLTSNPEIHFEGTQVEPPK